jgi:hypothetical protein
MVSAPGGRCAVAVLLCLAGCSSGSITTVMTAKRVGKGVIASYPVEPSKIWPAVEAALNWSSASSFQDHRDKGYYLVWFQGSNGNPLTFAGVWAEPGDGGTTRVTVVARKQAALRGSALSEEEFQRDLTVAVRFLVEGRPFPLVRPE